ncbi:ABC transporter ATP-binding protein, partial [Escherichia coli]|nr:ABC transporter ATP-binding protein [Escherichia coli]
EPTEGSVKINGKSVIVKNPNQANEIGIGMVHQHFKLVAAYTNLQNVIMGSEFTYNYSMGTLDLKLAKAKIKSIQEL